MCEKGCWCNLKDLQQNGTLLWPENLPIMIDTTQGLCTSLTRSLCFTDGTHVVTLWLSSRPPWDIFIYSMYNGLTFVNSLCLFKPYFLLSALVLRKVLNSIHAQLYTAKVQMSWVLHAVHYTQLEQCPGHVCLLCFKTTNITAG